VNWRNFFPDARWRGATRIANIPRHVFSPNPSKE
jgi:hypothetical protein